MSHWLCLSVALLLAGGCARTWAGPGDGTPVEAAAAGGGGRVVGDWVELTDDGSSITASWASPDSIGSPPSSSAISETAGLITLTSDSDGSSATGLNTHATFIDWSMLTLASASLGASNEFVLDHVTYWHEYGWEAELGAISRNDAGNANHHVMFGLGDYAGEEWIGGGFRMQGGTLDEHDPYSYYETNGGFTTCFRPGDQASISYRPGPAGDNPFLGTYGQGEISTVMSSSTSDDANCPEADDVKDAFDNSDSLRMRLAWSQAFSGASEGMDVDFTLRVRWVQIRDGTEGF